MNAIEAILRGHGLSDEPEKYDSSIHGWRCEYPDAYGRCTCFADLLQALAEHDRAVGADALRTYADGCREFQDLNGLVTWSDVADDVDEWAALGIFEKGADA